MRRLAFLLLLGGCLSAEDIDTMEEQPKYRPYQASELFPDGKVMRHPPEGTVPRERTSLAPPEQLTPELLMLGKSKFEAVCANCHGLLGDGESPVASKMALRPPPSLQDQKIRDMPAAQIFDYISDGYGLMPRLDIMLTVRERWAVIAYVRALQLSQNVPVDQLPADLRGQLERPGTQAPRPQQPAHGEGHH